MSSFSIIDVDGRKKRGLLLWAEKKLLQLVVNLEVVVNK